MSKKTPPAGGTNANTTFHSDRDRFMRLPAVMERTGKSRASIYRAMQDVDDPFPTAYSIGQRSVAWLESEIEAWIKGRIKARTSSPEVA